MRLSENRVFAWIVLAVCVVGSVFGLGGASLARRHDAAVEVFFEGAEDRDSNHSVNAYLERAFESARIMALEAQLHLGEENTGAKSVFNILTDFEARMEQDDDFSVRSAVCKALRIEADALYNEMYSAAITDEQRTDFKLAYEDFQGAFRMIKKDPYLELAGAFNDELDSGFIAGLAGKIHGARELSLEF